MLDRPIFLVGHARGGSTALGAMINWHSHVGPRPDPIVRCRDVNEMLDRTLVRKTHGDYSGFLERKDVWFDYFPGRDVHAHMGRELIAEDPKLNQDQVQELVGRLTETFRGGRFLSKAPTNSFRVKAIRKLFPDARIVAVLRRGEQVVSSWGRLRIGFGQTIETGSTRIEKLGYREGIEIFARKWLETIEYLESVREEVRLMVITYDQLVDDTAATLRRVFHHLELPVEGYINEIQFGDMRHKWKDGIPWRYRWLLQQRTQHGNSILRRIEQETRDCRQHDLERARFFPGFHPSRLKMASNQVRRQGLTIDRD